MEAVNAAPLPPGRSGVPSSPSMSMSSVVKAIVLISFSAPGTAIISAASPELVLVSMEQIHQIMNLPLTGLGSISIPSISAGDLQISAKRALLRRGIAYLDQNLFKKLLELPIPRANQLAARLTFVFLEYLC